MEVKFITEAKDFCVFFDRSYKSRIKKEKSNKTFDQAMFDRRKVERPPYEEILKDIKELGYTGTGKKYGVSDNAIRKWIKKYD